MSTKAIFNKKILSELFSDNSLTKKASLNALGAFLDYGARIVVGFVITPYIVSGLGDYLYGAFQILSRLVLYMSAASGRPTQALKWMIAHQQSKSDYGAKRRNVGSALAIWAMFVPVLTVFGGLLVWFAPVWLNASKEVVWIVRLAAAIMVVDLIMTSLADIPQSTLQGENLGYKRMGFSTLIVIIGGGGFTAIALYFKTGLIGVVAADLAYTLVAGAFFLYVAHTAIAWFGIARASIAEIRKFFGLSWWFFIWRLVMQLMMASDVIVLGRLGSVEGVTTYTLTKYVPETLISLVAIVVTGITPGLGGVVGEGNFRKANQVRNEIMAGTWLIATIVGTTTLLWNQDFVALWVGKEHYSGDIATMLIMIMVMQFVLIRNDANIIDLSLNLRYKVLTGILAAILSIACAAIFVGVFKWGLVGLCFGFIAGRLILSVGYPWFIGRLLGVPLSDQLKGVPRPAIVTGSLFFLAIGGSKYWTVDTWFGLVVSVGLTTIVVSLLAFWIGLSGEQRRDLMQRIDFVIRPSRAD